MSRVMLHRVVVCCALCAVVTMPVRAAGKVEVLGAFMGVAHTEEDAFGYVVKLWKEGDRIFGLLAFYTGPPADPPTGLLEDVKFDPKTRRLAFTARMSAGVLYSREYDGVPSRDRFRFEGVLTRRQVSGRLSHSNDLTPDVRPTSKRIRLRWSKDFTELMIPPPSTYSEWKNWADEILKRLGPKW